MKLQKGWSLYSRVLWTPHETRVSSHHCFCPTSPLKWRAVITAQQGEERERRERLKLRVPWWPKLSQLLTIEATASFDPRLDMWVDWIGCMHGSVELSESQMQCCFPRSLIRWQCGRLFTACISPRKVLWGLVTAPKFVWLSKELTTFCIATGRQGSRNAVFRDFT